MKNQYVCDIGDFGKYLLLHHIIDPNNGEEILSLGVNWYLSEDDGGTDGKFTNYLYNDKDNLKECLQPLSHKIYNAMRDIFNDERTVYQIEQKSLLTSSVYYHEILDKSNRKTWLDNSVRRLTNSDIIFLDPDNGIITNNNNSAKHVTDEDLKCYLQNTDSTIVIYHHGSRPKGGLINYSNQIIIPYIKSIAPDVSVRILWSHKGTARLYIFIIRKNKALINKRIDSFMDNFNSTSRKRKIFSEI